MARLTGRGGTAARVFAVLAVAALAVVVAVLAVLALGRTAGTPAPPASAPPAPTFDFDADETPAPTPTPTAAVSSEDERFLALLDDEVWRATAGSCGTTPPVVERSADGGATWAVATPPAAIAGQVLTLSALAEGTGQAVVLDDSCTPVVARTYTAGADWESYDELDAVAYLAPGGRMIATPGAEIAAPCAFPSGPRMSRGIVGLVCDGTAYRLDDRAWTPLVADAIAVDALEGEIVVAHAADSCPAGVAVTRFPRAEGTLPLTCIEGAPTAAPAALAVLGDDIALWSGEMVLRRLAD